MKNRVFRRRVAAGAAMATVLTVLSQGVSTVQAAEPVEYVNLGDSFSAGSGVAPMAPGVTELCLQSAQNYAHLVAADRGYQLNDVSCGGAQTDDFYRAQYEGLRPQLDALAPSTDLVTVVVGGNNDNTFFGAMAKCIIAAVSRPGAYNPCQEQFGTALTAEVTAKTYPALVQTLTDVHTRAPRAQVAIVGYPWLLPATGSCLPQMPLAFGDVSYLHALQANLNDAVRRAAAETDSIFVDMAKTSLGRDGCQTPERRWVEPMLFATQPIPVHPNSAGERAMADAVLAAIPAL